MGGLNSNCHPSCSELLSFRAPKSNPITRETNNQKLVSGESHWTSYRVGKFEHKCNAAIKPKHISGEDVVWIWSDCLLAQADPSTSLTSLYEGMEWGDLWDDAAMLSVVRYLRGSHRLRLPQEWRAMLLKGLV